MRIVIVNPNTTHAMTETIAAAARQAASSTTEIVAVQPSLGPVSIEGVYDGALAVPGVIEEILRAEVSGAAAYIIACFDDTGLDAARSAAVAPVIGIGEAAFHVASLVSSRFTVITTLARSVPIIERNLAIAGLAARCARVRATDIPVLALEDPASNARARISDMIEAAIRDERADGIVLGCAGMANLAAELSAGYRLPVIEGVSAATRLAETLVGLRLTTSKLGLWASPLPKSYSGVLAHPKNV
jgi:allantoin racemase